MKQDRIGERLVYEFRLNEVGHAQIQDRYGWSQASQLADLACHDEIVLVQPLDLVGLQRDGGVTPAETDVGMVALFLSQSADPSTNPSD